MTPWLSLLYLYMIVIVVVIDLTMSSVIRVPISGCKDGYFVYKIPPGIYRNKDGSDQSVYPGAMCRACSVCPDGAATLSPCSQTEDTVCGGCVKQGYVFDEGTKSCQPEYIIKGQAEPEKHFGLNEFGETASINAPFLADYEDGGTGVSASSVEMLLGAAATLFAVVATTTVVLIVVCVVSTIKQIKTGKRKNEQDKHVTSKDKKGVVNVNFTENEEETIVCPLYTANGDAASTSKKGGDEKPWNSLLGDERTPKTI